jgi:hypothetical protein
METHGRIALTKVLWQQDHLSSSVPHLCHQCAYGTSRRVKEGYAPAAKGIPYLFLMRRCEIKKCEEEGVVAMESARVAMLHCHVHNAKGPGVDVSGRGRLEMEGGSIYDCVGGVWLWQQARASGQMGIQRPILHAKQDRVHPIGRSDGRGFGDTAHCVVGLRFVGPWLLHCSLAERDPPRFLCNW